MNNIFTKNFDNLIESSSSLNSYTIKYINSSLKSDSIEENKNNVDLNFSENVQYFYSIDNENENYFYGEED